MLQLASSSCDSLSFTDYSSRLNSQFLIIISLICFFHSLRSPEKNQRIASLFFSNFFGLLLIFAFLCSFRFRFLSTTNLGKKKETDSTRTNRVSYADCLTIFGIWPMSFDETYWKPSSVRAPKSNATLAELWNALRQRRQTIRFILPKNSEGLSKIFSPFEFQSLKSKFPKLAAKRANCRSILVSKH